MKKREERELKLYEKLGIKKFQQIGFFRRNFIVCGLIYPFTRLMNRKERYKCVDRLFYSQKSNYNLGEVKGIKDLEKYKKYPIVNSVRYLIDLATCIPIIIRIIDGRSQLLSTISTASAVIINMYCIMLQRYNYIRLNRVIEKAKKRPVQEEVKEVVKVEEKKASPVREVIRNSTIEQLKRYREYLTQYQLEHGITKEVQQKNNQNLEQNLVRVRVDNRNKGRNR